MVIHGYQILLWFLPKTLCPPSSVCSVAIIVDWHNSIVKNLHPAVDQIKRNDELLRGVFVASQVMFDREGR